MACSFSLGTTATISFLLLISSLPASSSFPSGRRRFSKIYAFGDSFTDTGNTHSATGPSSFLHVSNPPYGSTFFHRPTNRYSDGRLVVDFLASSLSLPFLAPYLSPASNLSAHGVNFAVAGSTALDHEFFVKNNATLDITPQSLSTQLQWFNKHLEGRGCRAKGSKECNAAMEDAIFWVGEIGVNDHAYSIGTTLSADRIMVLSVNKIFRFLQALLNKGAKYMVVQGLPLSGCLPLTVTLTPSDDRDNFGCSARVNNYTNIQNMLLQAKLQELRRQYPTAIISYADYYNAYRAIMKKPALYGFTEPFKVCCGIGGDPYNFNIYDTCGSPDISTACSDPSKFLNWDGVHLTEAAYKTMADMFFHHGYCRPSFDVLLSNKKEGR